MRRDLLLPIFLSIFLSTGCRYGPEQKDLHFENAILEPTSGRIYFSARLQRYQPPTGLNAFPDGGTNRFLTDKFFVGYFERDSQEPTFFIAEENVAWTHTAGDPSLRCQNEPSGILITQDGQAAPDR